MRRFISILMASAVVSSVLTAEPAAATATVLRPPTSAEVVEPFSLPFGPFGPGNRGIEYDTADGDVVTAAGPGVVIFAGPVAGELHLTVDHGGGLLSSYSFLDRLLVRPGDPVDAGESIALAGERLHFGTRIDGRYVDPETLFGRRTIEVALVRRPDSETEAAWLDIVARSEAMAFRGMVDGGSRWGLIDAIRWIGESLQADPFSPFRWLDPEQRLTELIDMVQMVSVLMMETNPQFLMARSWLIIHEAFTMRNCTVASVAVAAPSERRIAITIDGVNSSSAEQGSMSRLDLGSHGYEAGDLVRFSYSGGVVDRGRPASSPTWTDGLTATDYSANDTTGSVAENIDELVRTLKELGSANPGVPIDVYGHSLGGLLARLAVARVGGADGDVDIGVVVTFGAPNHGTPLAEIVQAFAMTTPGTIIDHAVGVAAPDFVMVADVVSDLSPSGLAGDTAFTPYPPGVTAVSIGGRGDLVVPASVTPAAGATNVIVGPSFGSGIHGDLPGLPESDREVALALAGLPTACESSWSRLIDGSFSFGIEQLERAVAVGLVAGVVMGAKG